MKKTARSNSRPRVIGNFKVPDWWDCQWRRTPCSRKDCKLCAPQAARRQAAAGEGADALGVVMRDVNESMRRTMDLLKAEAAESGIDLDSLDDGVAGLPAVPEPDQFELYNDLLDWYDDLMDVFHDAYSEEIAWAATDAAADVTWYASTLLAKTYRQLTTRWEFENAKDLASDVDYIYTHYVLEECLRILRRSLRELAFLPTDDQRTLRTAEILLAQFEPQLLQI